MIQQMTGMAPILRNLFLMNLAVLSLVSLSFAGSIFGFFRGSSNASLDLSGFDERTLELIQHIKDHKADQVDAIANGEEIPEVDHSKMNLFIGILTRPGDSKRREWHRNVCGKEYAQYSSQRMFTDKKIQIQYKFFVGRPAVDHLEFKVEEHDVEGRQANAEELKISKDLDDEFERHGDIVITDFLDTADAENKIGKVESVYEYGLEMGLHDVDEDVLDGHVAAGAGHGANGHNHNNKSKKQWTPTHIAKIDGDYCLDADALEALMVKYNDKIQHELQNNDVSSLQEKASTDHGEINNDAKLGNWENQERVRFTKSQQLETGYTGGNNAKAGSVHMFTGVSPSIANLMWDSTGNFKRSSSTKFMKADQLAEYALEHINSKYHPRLQLIGAHMWSAPAYKSQIGMDHGFAPYPSHWMEIMSVDLAKAIFYSDRFHTKNWGRYGQGSEDVMVGRWAAYAISHHDLVVDYLDMRALKSKNVYSVSQEYEDRAEQIREHQQADQKMAAAKGQGKGMPTPNMPAPGAVPVPNMPAPGAVPVNSYMPPPAAPAGTMPNMPNGMPNMPPTGTVPANMAMDMPAEPAYADM